MMSPRDVHAAGEALNAALDRAIDDQASEQERLASAIAAIDHVSTLIIGGLANLARLREIAEQAWPEKR